MSDNAIEIVARWIEEGGPSVNLESTRKLMADTVRTFSHSATQAGAVQAVSDEQIMEIGHRHFKPNPDLTDSAKAAFVASVRECLALAATQPSAAPGDAPFEPAFLDTGKLRAADLHRIWQRVAPQGADRAALQWHVAQFAHAVQAEAAPGDGPLRKAVEDFLFAYRAKYKKENGSLRANAPMFDDVKVLNAVFVDALAAPSTATAAREQQTFEQQTFEQWAEERGRLNIRDRWADGSYVSTNAKLAQEAWNAALASRPEAPAAPSAEGASTEALKWCAAALQAVVNSRGERGSISMIVSGEKKSLEEVLDMADEALKATPIASEPQPIAGGISSTGEANG